MPPPQIPDTADAGAPMLDPAQATARNPGSSGSAQAEPPPVPEKLPAPRFTPTSDSLERDLEEAQQICRERRGQWKKSAQFQVCQINGRREGWLFLWSKGTLDQPSYLHMKLMTANNELQGPLYEYTPAGRQSLAGQVEAGERQGLFRGRHPGGQPASEYSYVAGKREGPAVFWYESCHIRGIGQFKNNQMHGPWTEWSSRGLLRYQGSYDLGERAGVWRLYTDKGVRHREGPMVHDKPHGVWKEWSETGAYWREVEYREGVRVDDAVARCEALSGEWRVDYEALEEGCLVERARQGEWRGFHPGGSLRWFSQYQQGELQGPFRSFHPGEPLKAPYRGEGPDAFPALKPLQVGAYEQGVPEGTHTFTGPAGEIYGTATVEGGDGGWESYGEKGQLIEQGEYIEGQKHGVWRAWYSNGNVKEEITWRQGSRDGPATLFFETGEVKARGQYYGGFAQGAWAAYYPNGRFAWRGQYERSNRVGDWTYNTWEALPEAEGAYEGDDKSGEWREYHSNGKLKAQGPYLAGVKEGRWTEYWPSGELWRTVNYVDGQEDDPEKLACDARAGRWAIDPERRSAGCDLCQPTVDGKGEPLHAGLWRWWYPNGQLERAVSYEAGERDGAFQAWFENGQMQLEGVYREGEASGEWRGWHADGKPRFEGAYRLGKEHGAWRVFHTEGSLSAEGRYAEGQRAGPWRWLYAGGQRKEVGAYDAQGLPTGVWQSWYQAGQKRSEGAYKGGQKDGEWQWWHADGKPWRQEAYTYRPPDAGVAQAGADAGVADEPPQDSAADEDDAPPVEGLPE